MSAPKGRQSDPRIKGGAIRAFVFWYEERYGRARLVALFESLGDEARQELDLKKPAMGLLPSEWYPTSLVVPILDAVSKGLTPAERSELAREGASAAVKGLSHGIYRSLFRMVASPRLYARYIQRAWNVLHTTGKRNITIEYDGYGVSTISEWPGHHPLLCEITTETMRSVFEAMGKKNVVIDRIACVSAGSTECKATIRYED